MFAGSEAFRISLHTLIGMTIAVAATLFWPTVAPVVEAMLMWLTRCMEYRPCNRVDGAHAGAHGFRDGIPPRPAAPGVAPYGYR
jgi:hypothetical protein